MLILVFLFSGISGVIKAFSIDYTMFAVMEFIGTMLATGMYITIFILAVELVGPTRRVLAGVLISVCNSISTIVLGLLAIYIHNFRILLVVLFAPSLIILCYLWFIPESVRWLISKGKYSKVKDIITVAAKRNKVVLSNSALDIMNWSKTNSSESTRDLLTDDESEGNSYPFWSIFRSKTLFLRLLNCGFCWFVNTFIYYGLNFSSVSLDGNKYLNFTLLSLAELPATIVTYFIIEKFGRKVPLCTTMVIAGIACIVCELMPVDANVARLVALIIGKCGICLSFTVIYVYTAELFPTNLRQSLMNMCYTFGRFGSISAPQTPLLVSINSICRYM